MTDVRASLWSRLHQAGVVAEPEPPPTQDMPWYIQLLLAACAWLAAGFLMGFFGMLISGLFDNAGGLLVLGLLCCAGALGLLRAGRDSVFVSQLALPVSLAGQCLVAAGAWQFGSSHDEIAAGMAMQLVGVAMALLSTAPTHRFLSSGMALCGLAMVMVDQESHALLPPLLASVSAAFWLGARRSLPVAHYLAWRPAANAVSLALVVSVWFVGVPLGFDLELHSLWMARLVTWNGPILAVLWLVVVVGLLRERGHSPLAVQPAMLLGASLLLALLLASAPGVLACLILLALGFAALERSLLALGILGLLAYLSRYYYQLDISLLAKSGVLVLSGAILIGLRFGLDWQRRAR